eukprot:2842459-Rhodomonas_salina.2
MQSAGVSVKMREKEERQEKAGWREEGGWGRMEGGKLAKRETALRFPELLLFKSYKTIFKSGKKTLSNGSLYHKAVLHYCVQK